MALAHVVTTSFGSNATYWVVDEWHIRPRDNFVLFILAGYVSKSAKNNGCVPIASRTYIVTTATPNEAKNYAPSDMYVYVKAQLEFSSAVDETD